MPSQKLPIQLGVASDQMEYDVIEKGSAGFLGIGSRQAVIRARIKKTVTEEIKAEEIKPEEIKNSRRISEKTAKNSLDTKRT